MLHSFFFCLKPFQGDVLHKVTILVADAGIAFVPLNSVCALNLSLDSLYAVKDFSDYGKFYGSHDIFLLTFFEMLGNSLIDGADIAM